MNFRAAITYVLDYVREWDFEDNPVDRNTCPSCGWESKKDWKQANPGLSHKPGCKLRSSMDILEGYDAYWRTELDNLRKYWGMFAFTREAFLVHASFCFGELGGDIRALHMKCMSVPGTHGKVVDTESAVTPLDEDFAMMVLNTVDEMLEKPV